MVYELVGEGGGEGGSACSNSSGLAAGGVEQVGEGGPGRREGGREEVDFAGGAATEEGFLGRGDGAGAAAAAAAAAAARGGGVVVPIVEDGWGTPGLLLGVGDGGGEVLEGRREGGREGG